MKNKFLLPVTKVFGIGALVIGLAAPALAVPVLVDGGVKIFAVDDIFDMTFSALTEDNDGNELDGALSATIWFKLTGFSGTTASFDVTINNMSVDPPQQGVVTGIGFGEIDPNATDATTSTTDWEANVGQGSFDVCLIAQDNQTNCFGGTVANGVPPGMTTVVNLDIIYEAGTLLAGGLFFKDPNARWQGVTGANCPTDDLNCLSAKIDGSIILTNGGNPPGGVIPEPGTLLLLGSGLAGLGFWRWNQKK